MNYITFKVNNVPCIAVDILYNHNKKIITFFYEVLTKHTNFDYCYKVKDLKEFNMIKQYIINSTINGNSFFSGIDLSSIKLL